MGNTSRHSGRRVMLPMSTKSLMPLLSVESTAAEPMVSSTMIINPLATSASSTGLFTALPKSEAVAKVGNPGSSSLLMSLICRFTLLASPWLASSTRLGTLRSLSSSRDKPCSVPPPMLMPPACTILSPLTCTSVVPVPIDTTMMGSVLTAYLAPRPSLSNSPTLLVGKP